MDKSCAQEWKFKGNQAFKQNNYQKAIEYFTKALEFDPDDHVFYSNRSACYATVGEYNKALEDAVMCCEIRPDWVKGYTRKALAEFYLGNYPDAINTYKKALEIEPENSDLKAGLLKATEASIKKDKDPILSLFEGPALVRLMSHPRTKEFFQQSDFVSQLNAIQNDNKKSLEFMDDPRFMECLSVLLGQESAYSKPQVNESSSQNDRSSRRYDEDHQSQKTAEEEKTLGNAAFNKKM